MVDPLAPCCWLRAWAPASGLSTCTGPSAKYLTWTRHLWSAGYARWSRWHARLFWTTPTTWQDRWRSISGTGTVARCRGNDVRADAAEDNRNLTSQPSMGCQGPEACSSTPTKTWQGLLPFWGPIRTVRRAASSPYAIQDKHTERLHDPRD